MSSQTLTFLYFSLHWDVAFSLHLFNKQTKINCPARLNGRQRMNGRNHRCCCTTWERVCPSGHNLRPNWSKRMKMMATRPGKTFWACSHLGGSSCAATLRRPSLSAPDRTSASVPTIQWRPGTVQSTLRRRTSTSVDDWRKCSTVTTYPAIHPSTAFQSH